MTLQNWIFALLAVAVIAAIYLTTPGGRRLADRLELPTPRRRKQRAPSEDRDYLLRVCNQDPARVERLLAEARRHDPGMSDAEAYRKAIRAHLNKP
jgi:hypothetical protein